MNFLANNKVVQLDPDVTAVGTLTLAAGVTDPNSEAVDRKGFEEVSIIALFGDNDNTGVFTMALEHSDDNVTFDACQDADGVAITESFTAGATDSDFELLGIGAVGTKLKRYVRVAITRVTANTVLRGLVAVLSNPHKAPVTQDTAAGQWIETPEIYNVCS